MISLHEGRGGGTRKHPTRRRARILALRVTQAGVAPRIWRRLLVADTMRLGALHDAVQALFGWCDYQAHVFTVGGRRYGNPANRDGSVIEDDRLVTLADAKLPTFRRAVYDYLFAESWRVDIQVERSAAGSPGAAYPRCVAGQRAGTPEDCGGVEAYADMLYCLRHPETDLGREWRAWLGPDYDPEAFDLAAANRALRRRAT